MRAESLRESERERLAHGIHSFPNRTQCKATNATQPTNQPTNYAI